MLKARFLKEERLPCWAYEKVKSVSEIKNRSFYYSKDSIEHSSYIVPVTKIKGTTHPDYEGKIWIQMFNGLKHESRFDISIEEFNYVLDQKPDVHEPSYHKYGDDFYIGEGNHRSCISKFIGRETIRGIVTEHFFDHELFEAYNSLIAEGFRIVNQLENKDTYCKEDPYWEIHFFKYRIDLKSREAIFSFVNYYNKLKIKRINFLKASFLKLLNPLEEKKKKEYTLADLKKLSIELTIFKYKRNLFTQIFIWQNS